jgi:hypothetical protein
LPLMQPGCYLMDENVLAPSVFNCRSQVPFPHGSVLNPVQQPRVVSPRQLCNNLLHKLPILPRLGEGPHVFQVAHAEALDAGEHRSQISGKAIDDLGSPTLCLLAGEYIPANRPVQQDQFSINGEAGVKLRGADSFLD